MMMSTTIIVTCVSASIGFSLSRSTVATFIVVTPATCILRSVSSIADVF